MSTFGKDKDKEKDKHSSNDTATTSFGMPQRDGVNQQDVTSNQCLTNDPTYEEVIPRDAPPEIPSRITHSANIITTEAQLHSHANESDNVDEEETHPKMQMHSTADFVHADALPENKPDLQAALPEKKPDIQDSAEICQSVPEIKPNLQASASIKPDIPFTVSNESAIHRSNAVRLPLQPIKKILFSSKRVRSFNKKRPTILPPQPSNDEQIDVPTHKPTDLPTISEIEEFFERSAITRVYNYQSMTAPVNFDAAKYTLNLNKQSPK